MGKREPQLEDAESPWFWVRWGYLVWQARKQCQQIITKTNKGKRNFQPQPGSQKIQDKAREREREAIHSLINWWPTIFNSFCLLEKLGGHHQIFNHHYPTPNTQRNPTASSSSSSIYTYKRQSMETIGIAQKTEEEIRARRKKKLVE